ncbi:MAG: PadR family transcriptional regulator [Rubrobacteraceae bacterium]
MVEAGDKRNSQLLKGVLDMCLLAVIAEEPSYGYEMVRKMEDRGLELVGEGSIYPLLSRLQKGGYIEGYMVPSKEGPRRKYYRVLPAGQDKLQEWVEEWYRFSEAVGRVLREGIRLEQ